MGYSPWQYQLVVATVVFFYIAANSGPAKGAGCRVELCSRQYSHATLDAVPRGPSYYYCTILQSYAACIKNTARQCRGELDYHSISSLVLQWNRNYNCSHIIAMGPPHGVSVKRLHPPVPRGNLPSECVYRPDLTPNVYSSQPTAKIPYNYCSFFGDPHLRTFYNELQTCRVKGAWPLIDNPYLAVQVTNVPVHEKSRATAISKITVIVRKQGACMTQEKVYEAGDGGLPGSFQDGTASDERGAVTLREVEAGRHVELQIRHAGALLVLRRVGRYLTFAARLPAALAASGYPSSLELCSRGCPKRERIQFRELYASPKQWAKEQGREAAVGMTEAIARCHRLGVSDFFFDACVFDLLTTGDMHFAQTAYLARKDMAALGPNKLTAEMPPPPPPPIENHGPGRPHAISSLFLLLSVLCANYCCTYLTRC